MDELSQLALKYGTDKGPNPGHHNYTVIYNELFGPIRNKVASVLEIGVYQGASLYMWRDYFPNAMIYGLDYCREITPKRLWLMNEDRIVALCGDQSSELDLQRVVASGAPFDIVIDDASHSPSDYLTSLRYLWPSATKFYVIEEIFSRNFSSRRRTQLRSWNHPPLRQSNPHVATGSRWYWNDEGHSAFRSNLSH